MYLQTLQLQHVRNLNIPQIEFGRGFNLFIGANASGKTSLLESINLLSLARSFRTHQIREVITEGHDSLTVVGKLSCDGIALDTAGIKKGKHGNVIRFNGQTLKSSSELAVRIPLIIVSPDSFSLILGGPTERRLLLDWGMFHVEQAYLQEWKTYQRCLKQRNTSLRKRASRRDVQLWDLPLSNSAQRIHQMRSTHVQYYQQELQKLCESVFEQTISVKYLAGWELDTDLAQQLEQRYERDLRLGYTNRGPHRSDLSFTMAGKRVKSVLSRGQAKLLTAIMRIAQARLLKKLSGKSPLVLVDDLPAELDKGSRKQFLDMLEALDTQVMITSTEEAFVQEFNPNKLDVFHVEHGQVRKVL